MGARDGQRSAATGDQATGREDGLRFELRSLAGLALTGGRDDGGLARAVRALLRADGQVAPSALGRLAAELAEAAVVVSWRRGWQPVDLAALARRRLAPRYVPVVAEVVRVLTERFPAARVDPRWTAQLAATPEDPALRDRVEHLEAWAGTEGGLAAALAVLGLTDVLPVIASEIPLPGVGSVREVDLDGVDARALGRVRALLAKAESTTFPEEAETLSAKAQELMSRLSIDVFALQMSGPAVSEVRQRRIWLDAPYVLAKAQLADSVARANRCRLVVTTELGFATVFGSRRDVDDVDLMTTSLLVQANRALLAQGQRGRVPGRPLGESRSRAFRQSFLVAYAQRIGERLTRADEEAVAARPDASDLLPALRTAEQRVADAVRAAHPGMTTAGASVTDGAGWAAGRAAADQAVVRPRTPLAG